MLPDDSDVVTMRSYGPVTWLLADEAQPVLGVAGLTVGGLCGVVAMVLRRRAALVEGSIAAIFFTDAATVLAVLGAAAVLVSAAIALGFEGLGSPLWLLIVIGAVAIAAGLLARKWRAELAAEARRYRRVTPTGTPERRIVSSAWERGVIAAGGAGLLTYIMTVDHGFGHPPHWIITGVGLLVGYAVAVAATTPHFRLAAPPTRK